jgi:hypothetical protein
MRSCVLEAVSCRNAEKDCENKTKSGRILPQTLPLLRGINATGIVLPDQTITSFKVIEEDK